ncbi:unnamed protein product [Calypogeia fissa]
MSKVHESFVTLHAVKIDSMWGLCAGSYVYEGCNKLLGDGWYCALGKHKRRLRRKDPESPMGPHSRGRDQHVCCIDGAGTFMFFFAVQIGDVVIQVNEENGMKLMGMSGEKFRTDIDGCTDKIEEVCAHVESIFWTFTYVKDGKAGCRAISVFPTEALMRNKLVDMKDAIRSPSMKRVEAKGLAGPSKTEGEDKGEVDSKLRTGFQVKTRLAVDDSCSVDFSGEIVTSFKSFRIKDEE